MTENTPRSVETIYDDMTANYYVGDEYAWQRPSFEEFARIYELLVVNFYHNMKLANTEVNGDCEAMLDIPASELRSVWEQAIWTWYDVQDFVGDWVYDRLAGDNATD